MDPDPRLQPRLQWQVQGCLSHVIAAAPDFHVRLVPILGLRHVSLIRRGTTGLLASALRQRLSRSETPPSSRCACLRGEVGDVVELPKKKALLTPNVGRGWMKVGHRFPTMQTTQTTPTPSSPRDYRTANPIYSNYRTTSPWLPPWI